MSTRLTVARLREDFPILRTRVYGKPLVYLDNAATTQKPRIVIDTIGSFYTTANANIHRGSHFLSARAEGIYESVREQVRAFINAESCEEIVFTHGTTSAINLVAGAFADGSVGPGDEIITTEMEHHSNLIPWQVLCRRTGARLKILPFDEAGNLHTEHLDTMIGPRTRLVACGYVSNVLGTINPIEEIIARAHARAVPVLIDGAQAVQHMPIDVRRLDCDFFAFSGHKMYAGTGVGVLYGKHERLRKLPPYQYGGGMVESVGLDKATFTGLPTRFEAGTPNIAGVAGLGAAIGYLQQVGMASIREHESHLLEYARARLAAVEGVRVYGNATRRCSVVSFNLDSLNPHDIGMILDKLGIAVRTGTHCAEPVMRHYGITGTVRAGLGMYNTMEEVDALIDGVRSAGAMLR